MFHGTTLFHGTTPAPPTAPTAPTAPTQILPAVNTLVRLTLGSPDDRSGTGPRNLPSRVEDSLIEWPAPGGKTFLYAAAPVYAGDLEGPEQGSPCQVVWPTPTGLFRLPTRFDGRTRIGPLLRAWRLLVDGPATRLQRRRYFRIPWVGPVTLELRPDDPAAGLQVLTGTTLDLSEGGLRVALPVPGLPEGCAIRVLLRVRDRVLVLPATTVWRRPATSKARLVETGVSFDDVEEHGDLLRRVVIDEQLRTRRAGLR